MRKFIFCLTCLFICFFAHSNPVKVGYYIDSGNFMSGFSEKDPKGGYAYEYLQTISAYTGWEYEYVYGYFNDLYEKLVKGEIDLLTDVSYTPERTKDILYSDHPMGTESYYIYVNDQKNFIEANQLSKINNMSLALLKGSYQYDLCKKWLKQHNLSPKIYEFEYHENISDDFESGAYDLYMEIDTVAEKTWEPIAKIGESDFYIAVTKSREDLLEELNYALKELNMTNPYYNSTLWAKYFVGPPLSRRLSKFESDRLHFHKEINIGTLNNSLPYSNLNEKTQLPEGLIFYLLNYINLIYEKDKVSINYTFFENYTDLINALKNEEIDLAFPITYNLNEAEKLNLHLSFNILTTPMSYVFHSKNSDRFMESIATTENSRSQKFAERYYPSVPLKSYATREDCLNAVLKKEVSGTLFDSYKINNMLFGNKKYKDLRLISLPETATVCFAANKNNIALLSLLNKVIATIPEAEINHVINQYSIESKTFTLKEFIENYAEIIFICIFVFLFLIISLIASLDKLAELINYDVLTHLLNRRRLTPYMNTALERAKEKGDIFSILMFDLDNFKNVNDTYGHGCGDEILKMAATTISKGVKRNDFVFRWGGEEILVLLKADHNIALKVAERIRKDIEFQIVEYKDIEVCITATVGVATYMDGCTAESLFALADENLYKGKKNGKNQVVG